MSASFVKRVGVLCTGLAAACMLAGLSSSVFAQDHGVGIRKSCPTPTKVGDIATCTMRVINEDDFGDAIEVLEFWDIVGTGANQFRVPATGNLPIIEVTANVICALDAGQPIGLTFPCTMPGALNGSGEYVRVRSQYTVPEWAEDPLLDQANAVVRDLCDVQPIGCNPNPQLQQFGASVSLFEPDLEVTKSGPDAAKVGDEVCWEIGFRNTSQGTGFPGFENCLGTDTFLGDLGAFTAGVPRTFCHTASADDPNPIINTATITCGVVGFDNQVSDSDDHSVDLIDPAIEVTKSGPDAAKVGDEICWDIGFADIGTGTLENCSGTDTFLGDLGAFEAGINRQFCHTATADDPDPITNTATITCGVVGFDNQVSDSDDHSVDLVDPSVSLTKLCRPDPVLVGETIYWSIQIDNTGTAGLDCLLNDPDAGFIDEAFSLDPGESESFNASRLVELGDAPMISNTASVSCDVFGFDNQVSDSDSADCAVEVPGEEVCRTPGFWGTHAGTENRRATNLTQLVIDAAGGSIEVCGTTLDNTSVGSTSSALEAMCVSVQGEQQRQLARQLTAMALNCTISNGSADCAGTSVEGLFADANAACAADDSDLSDYIARVDCFNNGGQWNWDEGSCYIDPDDPNNCQNRDLDYSTDIFDGVHPLPGPAGSPRACNAAIGNDIYVVP